MLSQGSLLKLLLLKWLVYWLRMGKDVWGRIHGCCPLKKCCYTGQKIMASDLAAEELQGWAQEAAKSQSAPTFATVSCTPANSQNPFAPGCFPPLPPCFSASTSLQWHELPMWGEVSWPNLFLHMGTNSRHTKNGCWHPGSGMICPTAKCCVPSKHGMDVSCCLASCSPVTKGNHLKVLVDTQKSWN